MRWVVPFIAGLATGACSGSTDPNGGLPKDVLMPLDSGATWVYVAYDSVRRGTWTARKADTFTVRVTGTTSLGGRTWSVVTGFAPLLHRGATQTMYLRNFDDGLYESLGPSYSPPIRGAAIPVFKYPIQLGDQGTTPFPNWRVVQIDTALHLPAGDYRAIHFKILDDFLSYYAVPGVGVVMKVLSHGASVSPAGDTILLAYRVTRMSSFAPGLNR